jgi:hypothetical protein
MSTNLDSITLVLTAHDQPQVPPVDLRSEIAKCRDQTWWVTSLCRYPATSASKT